MLKIAYLLVTCIAFTGCATSSRSAYEKNLSEIELAKQSGSLTTEQYIKLKLEAERNYIADRKARSEIWQSSFSTDKKTLYSSTTGQEIGTIE